MKNSNFLNCLKLGQVWENDIERWMDLYFRHKMPDWQFKDTKDVHRDEDGDQFPDYVIYAKDLSRYCFLDAKKRNVYLHRGHRPSFGFDRKFYHSYTNISKKHDTKVFVAFRDNKFDSDNFYILDLDQQPDFVWDYGNNGHGEPICYRWYIDNLVKMVFEIPKISDPDLSDLDNLSSHLQK
jgi:hypothetical protein